MRLAKVILLPLLVLPAMQACGQTVDLPQPPEVALSSLPERPDGPVLDQANILRPEEEATLDSHLRSYWDSTGTAIVVASVKSLDGRDIDSYATALFNRWGIGDARTNRGLLVLVAPNEQQVRIEVGCGLEIPITNDVAGEIIEKDMIPLFKTGDLQGGTLAGVQSLEKRLDASKERGSTSPICTEHTRKAA